MSSDILRRIKRTVLAGNYAFSEKALLEMEADGLTELDVAESILNAVAIYKTIRLQSRWREQRTEYLHIIQSTSLDGLMIYSKGKLIEEAGIERYYLRDAGVSADLIATMSATTYENDLNWTANPRPAAQADLEQMVREAF